MITTLLEATFHVFAWAVFISGSALAAYVGHVLFEFIKKEK